MRFVKAVPVARLKPFPGNPRKHGPDISRLQESIQAYGWTNPVLVQERTNRIIAGHGRIEAAKKAGIKTVPVVYLSLTRRQATAYTIADNRLAELSEWDLPRLNDLLADLKGAGLDTELTGFTDAELEKLLGKEPELVEPGDERNPFTGQSGTSQECPKCGFTW